jgi:hypothetical protein
MNYVDKAKTMTLPPLPRTHEKLGEEKYCEIAKDLGYFDPKKERVDYRPALDPTPFLSLIKKEK